MVPASYRAPRDPLGSHRDGQRSSAREAAPQRQRGRPRGGRSSATVATSGSTTRPPRTPASASSRPRRRARAGVGRRRRGPARRARRDPADVGDDDDAGLAEGSRRRARRRRLRARADDAPRTCRQEPRSPRRHAEVAHEHAPARKQRGRVVTFLRRVVDELRRVQWPDRRQVGQGTAVVLGFVSSPGPTSGLLDAIWKPHHPGHPLGSRDTRNPCFAGTSSTPIPGTRTRSSRTSSTACPPSNQSRAVRQVVVPTETVQEMKDNQKISVEKRTMPGYVLVNMDLNEDSWQVVKGTPGVTGFVGASNEPIPLTQAEVDRLLHREVARQRAEQRPVLDRRIRQGDLRPAVGLLGRDLRDQRGRVASSRCWYPSSGARRPSRSGTTR